MVVWQVIVLCIATLVVVNGQQRICMQIESVNTVGGNVDERSQLRGVPGKKGMKGDVGPPGRAVKGDPGDVNYERIFSRIKGQFSDIQNIIETRMREMEDRFEESIARSLDARNLQSRLHAGCPLFYKDRCFRAIVHSSQNVNFARSRSLCNRTGEHPANIYDEQHMIMISALVREQMHSGQASIFLWTGMGKSQRNAVTLFDGSPAPFVKWWRSGLPEKNDNHILLRVRLVPHSSNQAFGDTPAGVFNYHGVVCEA